MSTDKTQGIRIVEAAIGDLDMIVPLFDQYRMFYKQDSDLDRAQRFLRARIEHRDSVIYFAVEGDGADEMALGFTLLYPSFDSVRAKPIWILNDLYILEGVRRRGLARLLIDHGRQLAEDTGAHAVSLSTASDNAPSRQLYEALGFKLDETFCTYILGLESATQ